MLAAAGLARLGRDDVVAAPLEGGVFVPAPGQGCLLVQSRSDEAPVDAVDDAPARAALTLEREVAGRLGASCRTAIGVHAAGDALRAFAGLPDGSEWLLDEVERGDGAAERLADAPARRRRGRPARPRRGDDRMTPGTVYLVGAGPGDPGLLTVRAAELIARADVILHDRLIPATALDGARPDAELVFVGKQGGGAQVPQTETNRLLLERARAGKDVVRLKGGDPFVFGRGGEEALLCLEAGVPFEVVPGVTAGVAAPAYAGIPVTHRELASGVAFVTGHEDPAKPDSALDWPALAAFPGTLVFYMGVRALPRIAEQLVAAGRPPEEPVAVIERGTLPGQRTLLATLADVAGRAAAERIRAPAIALVGPVAALREQLAWLERRPLHGRTVAVTRARPQASALAARLRELGATVIEAPAIRTRPLDAELPDLAALRSPLRHVAERRPPPVRAPRRRRPRRARARRCDGRRDRPGHGARAGRARHPRRRRAGSSGRRGPRRGAGRRRDLARAGRARARGPRRAARRAARARRRASTCSRCTRRWPSRSMPRRRRPPPARTTSRSRRPRPCAPSSPPRARRPVRASPRSARRRARRCARRGSSPAFEADPHTPDGLVAALVGATPPPRNRRGSAPGARAASSTESTSSVCTASPVASRGSSGLAWRKPRRSISATCASWRA